jgi:hypothetical protein
LRSLLSRKAQLSAQEARWAQILWSFPVIGITYREGKKHCNADAMSRHPVFATRDLVEETEEETTNAGDGPVTELERGYEDAYVNMVNIMSAQLDAVPWTVDKIPKLQGDDASLAYVRMAVQGDAVEKTKLGAYAKMVEKIHIRNDIMFLDSGPNLSNRVLVTL